MARVILNLFGGGGDDKEAPHVTPASPWTSRNKSINMELAIHKCSEVYEIQILNVKNPIFNMTFKKHTEIAIMTCLFAHPS